MAILLALIITILPNGVTKLTAEDGKAIRRVGTEGKSTITEVYLSKFDKAENWEDCEFGQPDPETPPDAE